MRLLQGERLKVTLYAPDGAAQTPISSEVGYGMSSSEFALRFAEHLPPGAFIRLQGSSGTTGKWSMTYRVGRVAGLASVEGASLPRSVSDPDKLPFGTWNEVLDFVRSGRPIYYRGPMDTSATRVLASVRGNGRKVRVATGSEADDFWADEGHLSRFSRGR